ncbi:MAG: 3-dehydroquinate synthase [Epsilonproteobacteria bacterium]|nr:3-dehydroquinate synthase [Campylobacterota bacterium]
MTIPVILKKECDDSYKVIIDDLDIHSFDTKVAIVTNTTVANFHLKTLLTKITAKSLNIIIIPDGEEYKNIETLEYILNKMFEYKLDRKSILIAFGGGVVGDMTGFAASIYQRGIDFMQIPTTLLAQVDASVGGKTGINNKFGKNLIGTFHQPKSVCIDTAFLKTLPKREFGAGFAEIVKMAVTFDKEFFEFLENADMENDDTLKKTIAKCIKLKAEIVGKDEKETDIRAALNYGHTFGHVIENETKYSEFLHGEAVAMGMVMANELACELGFMTKEEALRVIKLLEKYDLPTKYKIKNIDDFYEHFFLDKKSSNNKIKFILPKHIGNHIITSEISEKIVKKVLKKLGDN